MLAMEHVMGGRKIRINRGGRRKQTKTGADYGTEQLQRRRIEALGGRPTVVEGADVNGKSVVVRLIDGAHPDQDTALAQSPLGIYLARGLLDDDLEKAKEMHQAGMFYRYAYGIVFGRSGVRSFLDASAGGLIGELEDPHEVMNLVYRAMAEALTKIDRQVFNAVWRVCVGDEMVAAWYLPRLRIGLRHLVRHRRRIYAACKRIVDARKQKLADAAQSKISA